MNELKKDTTHAIVQFVTKNSQNEESIDLVPRSWLKFTNKCTCYFSRKKKISLRLTDGQKYLRNQNKIGSHGKLQY